jgi:UDP-N-acetylglucosamine 4,6-dehydratase
VSQTVLITGGTGFLGKRLGIALKNDYRVVLTGRNNKQNQAAAKFTGCEAMPLDVSSIEAVRDTIVEVRPDIIIHAAATKFVDLAEKFPMECIDVNVVGSQNVARVAVERGVSAVVGISTDKAAPPVRNTYGMSKAIMERIFCSMDGKTDTRFFCARYGNVAWSTGSVLPIWKKMHAETGVIGTTGPDMTRFFFTVDDAVGLILRGLANLDTLHGKVLSMRMKSALIRDLLNVWIEEFGGRWEKIDGRPGERNLEYLIGDLELEHTTAVELGGIEHYVISFNKRFENHVTVGLSSDNTERLSRDEIVSLLANPPAEER